jgi:excisionase family DNA binding protein
MIELLTVRELAARMKISRRHIWKLHSSGRLPGAVRLGRSVRWRASDVDEWDRLGCVSREQFEATCTAGAQV